MKKSLTGILLLLLAAGVVGAQEEIAAGGRGNAAAAFGNTSATKVELLGTTREPESFLLAMPLREASAEPGGAAAPAAKPTFVFGDRDDYRWQLGIGLEYLRFRSNVFDASLVGTNTTLTYFTNGWFALEGNLVTGFAPTIYQNEHVKFFGGAGGLRIGSRRAKWEPWGHALVGGSHLQPQTAGSSRSALMAQAGIGVDYRVHARLSLRLEGDWVYTTYFHQTQNQFQGVAAVVLHF